MPFDFDPVLSQQRFLPGRASLPLDDAEGTVIAVERGCLWVTMENDPRDVILTPGLRFEVDRSGRTIIAAEEDSRFRLLADGGCAESTAASIARKVAIVFDRWSPRKAAGLIP